MRLAPMLRPVANALRWPPCGCARLSVRAHECRAVGVFPAADAACTDAAVGGQRVALITLRMCAALGCTGVGRSGYFRPPMRCAHAAAGGTRSVDLRSGEFPHALQYGIHAVAARGGELARQTQLTEPVRHVHL